MKWNVGWDFPSEISDLIVGRTGAVGNPLFANQGLWNTNLYYKLITGVLYFPQCIKFPTTSQENRRKRDETISRVESKKTHNNIQKLFWKQVSPENSEFNRIKKNGIRVVVATIQFN